MIETSADIRGMTVPWLLQNLHSESKTGTATFSQGTDIIKIFFRGGDIIFASSNLDADRLGECLLRSGQISSQQFEASAELVKNTGKKLPAVLVQLGFISSEDLISAAKLQLKQIILNLFAWRKGRYLFEENALPSPDIVPLPLSTGNVILEGVRCLDWKHLHRALPPLKTTLRPSLDPTVLFQSADLEQDQLKIFSLIDGNKSIEQICSLSEMGDFNTLKSVYVLLALKMVEAGELKTDEEKIFVREVVHDTISAKQATREREAKTPVDATTPPQITKQTIQDAFDALKNQDYYEALGVARNATAGDLKKAYFRLAKIYHPDRHFEAEMADMKEKLNILFTSIHDAYDTLNNPAQRQEYDKASAREPEKQQNAEAGGGSQESGPEKKSGQADVYFEAGMKDLKMGNFWGAADYFSSAVRLDPAKPQHFYQYGIALMHIPRRLHEAEENIKKAVEMDPRNTEYNLALANLYLKSGLKDKAIDVYQSALRENPESEKIREALKAAGGTAPRK